jgi:hypothetical protein
MNDYGKGSVLGAVSILPVTAASAMLFFHQSNPLIVGALFGISLISLGLLLGHISRYISNRRLK